MATFSPVLRLMPSLTLEKWPVPRVSPISYSSMIAWSMSESLSFSISTSAQCTGRGRGLAWPGAASWKDTASARPLHTLFGESGVFTVSPGDKERTTSASVLR